MIQVGQALPEVQFQRLTDNGVITQSTSEIFKGEKVVLFAVPGAFTPTCSAAHLPGFVEQAQAFYDKGIDRIICVAVNDAFVMGAWGKSQNAGDILMLADGAGKFAQALGLEMDSGDFGGLRSRRYAMVVEDGVVAHLNVEEGKAFEVSKAEAVLALL